MTAAAVDELVIVNVDLERVPACEGFTDPAKKSPCPQPARYVVRLLHRRDQQQCRSALMCEEHLREHLDITAQIEARPDYLALCPLHLLPTDTKAVPL